MYVESIVEGIGDESLKLVSKKAMVRIRKSNSVYSLSLLSSRFILIWPKSNLKLANSIKSVQVNFLYLVSVPTLVWSGVPTQMYVCIRYLALVNKMDIGN